MTDIAIRTPAPVAEVQPGQDAAVARLAEWARAADAAYQIAVKLCGTSFAPVAYRGKPDEGTAAILAGAEVGLSPTASLRAFDNIQGTPAPKAMTLRSIVQAHGHEIRIIESTPERAVVSGRRKGDTDWQTSTWTIERAEQMGLTGKDQWKRQPAAMLVARATAEVCRWVASDAIMGMPYTAEEIRDDGDAFEARPRPMRVTAAEILRAEDTPPAITADPTDPVEVVVADHAAPPAPAEPPHPVSGPPADGGVKPQGRPITDKQKTLLHTLASKVPGLEDRDAKLFYVSQQVGRDVDTTNDLTMREAALVIASLERYIEQQEPPSDGTDG